MDRSFAKRQLLILDCCYSGAFARGTKGILGSSVGSRQRFMAEGFGRVILTATDAIQYAWDGNKLIGENKNSVFTHFLIEGLKTGQADLDNDGIITVDELYEFVHEKVIGATPYQTPSKWVYGQRGEIIIAQTCGENSNLITSLSNDEYTNDTSVENIYEKLKYSWAELISSKLSTFWILPDYRDFFLESSETVDNDYLSRLLRDQAFYLEGIFKDLKIRLGELQINTGPIFNRFILQTDNPMDKIELHRPDSIQHIHSLKNDIELTLGTNIIIEIPMKGKHRGCLGILAKKTERTLVFMKDLLGSPSLWGANLLWNVPIGMDLDYEPFIVNIKNVGHLLIIGRINSGKSAFIDTLLCTFLLKTTPNDLRIALIDFSRIEYTRYLEIPHLLIPVISRPEEIGGFLNEMEKELARRVRLFSELRVRDVEGHNRKVELNSQLPFIFLFINDFPEFHKLMSSAQRNTFAELVKNSINVGIHIVASSKSVYDEAIKEIVKTNLFGYVSFGFTDAKENAEIFDVESLPFLYGNGDILFKSPRNDEIHRIQGGYVLEKELETLIEYWSSLGIHEEKMRELQNSQDIY